MKKSCIKQIFVYHFFHLFFIFYYYSHSENHCMSAFIVGQSNAFFFLLFYFISFFNYLFNHFYLFLCHDSIFGNPLCEIVIMSEVKSILKYMIYEELAQLQTSREIIDKFIYHSSELIDFVEI